MVSFLSFVTLALAGMVVGRDVGRHKLRRDGNVEESAPVDCFDSHTLFAANS
jgi:hypothetical protein